MTKAQTHILILRASGLQRSKMRVQEKSQGNLHRGEGSGRCWVSMKTRRGHFGQRRNISFLKVQ